ncbi:MAG TPA: hypothetical protein VHE12_11100 [bacterium]|nr:hypothetical protein [bacterium]
MGELLQLLISIVVVLVIFLACRALMLWYWKIDKIEEHLKAIRAALEKRG